MTGDALQRCEVAPCTGWDACMDCEDHCKRKPGKSCLDVSFKKSLRSFH